MNKNNFNKLLASDATFQERKVKHFVSVSGGKDSSATLLKAREVLGDNFIAIFCDTGNEHQLTYDYIDYLNDNIHPIKRIKADFKKQIIRKRKYIKEKWAEKGVSTDIIKSALTVVKPTGNPFLDLCIWKGRFPSTRARFCSTELKRFVSEKQIVEPAIESGYAVVMWVGIRRDESPARANATRWHQDEDSSYSLVYRPIVDWSAQDVFDLAKKHDVKPNPLYTMGCKRVGCMPCIHAGKDELMHIANRFPDVIERIRDWERIVGMASKRGKSSFFAAGKTNNKDVDKASIDHVVHWSRTAWGGKQVDMLRMPAFDSKCTSIYGLCE